VPRGSSLAAKLISQFVLDYRVGLKPADMSMKSQLMRRAVLKVMR
jgi:hypothetical protein